MTMMKQYELQDNTTHTVTWLPVDKHLKTGCRITLKDSVDPKRVWNVVWAGTIARERGDIHSEWRVGGL